MSNDLQLLTEAIERYRKTTHPRWAQLAEWASNRLETATPRHVIGSSGKAVDTRGWFELEAKNDVLDVPRLLAAFVKGVKSAIGAERVTLLGKRKDPRVVSGLLRVLENPPWRAGTALPFFKACLEVLVASKDVRAKMGLESLSTRYKAIIDTSIGEVIAGHCARAAQKLADVEVPKLSSADEARLTELERLFETEKRATEQTASEAKRAKQSDDELLSAVYASPDDDGPRLVFADLLSERADERGEFISLQVHRAAGRGTLEMLLREQQLLADSKRRAKWELPLSGAATCIPRRGFPADVSLSVTNLKRVVGLPAWATVESMGLPNGASGKMLRALVDHEVMRRIRSVTNLSTDNRALLGDEPRPWKAVSFHYLHGEPFRTDVPERFPALEVMHLMTGGPIELEALAKFTGLVELRLAVNEQLTEFDWLTGLQKLERLDLQSQLRDGILPSVLARLPRLKRVGFGWAPTAERIAGVSVDTLGLGNSSAVQVAAVSRVLGQVRELELRTSFAAAIVTACLATWTASSLQRVRLSRSLFLERTGDRWSAHADFSRLEFDAVLALGAVPGIDTLSFAPFHVSPLSVPLAPPDDEQLAKLKSAWGTRFEVLTANPRVLATSLERSRLR
ncbi:MAG: TIGR02996 domain-containing protein [Myxococcales bacterium]|nr:TIGR02996 domain-containing protein [Myxococcales bacterium]